MMDEAAILQAALAGVQLVNQLLPFLSSSSQDQVKEALAKLDQQADAEHQGAMNFHRE
jgi:hypothetical protein